MPCACMIDMDAAYAAFRMYVSAYNPEDPKIALKIAHIVRVAKKSRKLAEELSLPREDIALAELIGLLHDIGRFEQVAQYNTFKDSDSINHGLMGCHILFGQGGIIRDFVRSNAYDDLIYTAVINHNRAFIHGSEHMKEHDLLHSKLIRDTDKLDIFRVQLEEPNIALFGKDEITDDLLTPAIYEDFCKEKLVDYSLRSGSAPDSLICSFGYVYDINFDESHAIALSDGYLSKLGEIKFSDAYTKEKMADACARALDYCRRRAANLDKGYGDAE